VEEESRSKRATTYSLTGARIGKTRELVWRQCSGTTNAVLFGVRPVVVIANTAIRRAPPGWLSCAGRLPRIRYLVGVNAAVAAVSPVRLRAFRVKLVVVEGVQPAEVTSAHCRPSARVKATSRGDDILRAKKAGVCAAGCLTGKWIQALACG
jgi:hypothetical protein